MESTLNSEKLDFEKVWLMFQETRAILDEKFRETDERFKETDEKFKETYLQMQKTDLQMQKTDLQMQKTDLQIKETDRIVRNLTNKVKESEKRWGKFVEALVEGKLVEMLNEKGIPVNLTLQRIKRKHKDDDYEIDLIAKNGNEIVVVEVKTTLGIEDVQHFIDKLTIFKEVISEFKENKVFGAVAYIQQDSEAQKYAAKKGLLVIKAVGESAKIENRSNFKPKEW